MTTPAPLLFSSAGRRARIARTVESTLKVWLPSQSSSLRSAKAERMLPPTAVTSSVTGSSIGASHTGDAASNAGMEAIADQPSAARSPIDATAQGQPGNRPRLKLPRSAIATK